MGRGNIFMGHAHSDLANKYVIIYIALHFQTEQE